jgi:hypothetical protein
VDVNNRYSSRGVTTGVLGGTAATDELNDFQAVAFPKGRLRPLFAGHDVAVQFNGDAILLHPQLFYQGSKRQGRREIAGFAINLNFHLAWDFRSLGTAMASNGG